jgi:tRNA1(Val) A37 N6-methylase TrmN6
VVLPVDIGNAFIERATAMGWHLRLRTDVAETELRPPHRVLLAFSPTAGSVSATGWRSAGQSSSILKALPL